MTELRVGSIIHVIWNDYFNEEQKKAERSKATT